MKSFIIYYLWYFKYFFNLKINFFKSKNGTESYIYSTMLYVLKLHHSVGQRYDKYPYFYHLKMVYGFSLKFRHLLTKEESFIAFLICLLHDTIEDCRLTYNDVKTKFGFKVADSVFACTDLRGKTRKERHAPEFYKLLKNDKLASYAKICDIIANMTMSKKTGSTMLNRYRKEYSNTKNELYRSEFDEMFIYIENNLLHDKK